MGIYKDESLSPFEASRVTTDRMLRLLPRIKRSTKILVLQSGFGTAARYIAETHQCKIECLNDDKVQNAFNQSRIDEMELGKMVKVSFGDVDYMPYEPDTFDFVIAQDSFSITAQKRQMFRAIHRVMKPEARLVFSAIMRGDKVDAEGDKLINSLPVEELITLEDYEQDAKKGFFQQIYNLDLSQHLAIHFRKMAESLTENKEDMVEQTSNKFVDKRMHTCKTIQKLAESGQLNWGILMFQKLNG
ncbi:SAM-dependent methyltransferase [Neolewinella agarilytica]|uniref:Sarcosine/dimethylglycine N-methyltransferase n=1 Tax=Neolewinella agarilytica TaxID=478744 RepID=A0A1H9KBZ2_9BACT|nr:methyltransferase domain-containing protein [Neolewinella agarilytica]SEQ96629.1 sarcosine/dimethylglycine N-methyltransferase [Neolewinella agarilytica]